MIGLPGTWPSFLPLRGLWASGTGITCGRARKNWPTAPRWKPRLADSLRLARYHNAVQRALDRVDVFFGERAFGWRAFNTCWLIAFFYPLMLFILTWAAGGPYTLGALELLPTDWHWALRWALVAGLAAYGYGLFLFVRHREKADVWLRNRLDRLFERLLPRLPEAWRRLVGALVLGLLVGGVVYVLTGSFAGAVAGAVAVALAVTVAGAVALAGAFVAYLRGGWAGVFDPVIVSVLIFLLILPLLNGLLDYVFWGISRRLGRALLKHFGRYTAIALAFVDMVCAVVLLVALAVVLCTAVETFNALALAKTGAEVLDVGTLLREAAAQPFGSGFWITAMLFSTLIPTVLHLGIAVASAIMVGSRSNDRAQWVEKGEHILEAADAEPYSEVERGRIARYLFFHRALGPLVLTAGLVALFVVGWSVLVGDISDTLLALAEWSRGVVHGG